MNQRLPIVSAVLICVALIFSQPASSQAIVTAELIAHFDKDSLTQRTGVPAQNGAIAYKLEYVTTGIDGMPDTASGLFVLPDVVTDKGIIAYQHGTTDGPDDVPSNFNTEALLVTGLAGQGYIMSACDYLGMGSSRGFHPYVHAGTEASAGIDMLIASMNMAAEMGHESISNIFVTGYSQGGHAAMAMAQAIEERPTDDLWLTASAPMSGPYSISEVMKSLTVDERDTEYLYPAYIAYILLGYQSAYGDVYTSLDEIFRTPHINWIEMFEEGQIGLSTLNAALIGQLRNEFGLSAPYLMFDSVFLQSFREDSSHFINDLLVENDTYRWVPNAPMRIFYCAGDDQVPFQNSLIADSVMNAMGAPDVQSQNLNPVFDHGACVLPAVLATLEFFNSFQTTTPVDDHQDLTSLSLYPNPAYDVLNIRLSAGPANGKVQLFDATGVLQKSFDLTDASSTLNVTDLRAGMYMVLLEMNGKKYVEKVLIK